MRNLISFMHISLDGFVCGPNGEMNWIKVDDEIFDYVEKRIMKTDTALYGRVTYEMMQSYWPTAADQPNASNHDKNHSKWYSKAHKIVLSNRLKDKQFENTTILSQNFIADLKAIKETEGSEILVFGSPSTTHALIHAGMIDGYWLFINPILLGSGIPLFSNGSSQKLLQRISTHVFKNGVTELNYEVKTS